MSHGLRIAQEIARAASPQDRPAVNGMVKPGCRRCGETGYMPQYAHVEGGICFDCRDYWVRNARGAARSR